MIILGWVIIPLASVSFHMESVFNFCFDKFSINCFLSINVSELIILHWHYHVRVYYFPNYN